MSLLRELCRLYLPIHGPQDVEDGPDADLLSLVDVHAVRVDLHSKFKICGSLHHSTWWWIIPCLATVSAAQSCGLKGSSSRALPRSKTVSSLFFTLRSGEKELSRYVGSSVVHSLGSLKVQLHTDNLLWQLMRANYPLALTSLRRKFTHL